MVDGRARLVFRRFDSVDAGDEAFGGFAIVVVFGSEGAAKC